jgi:hypothetical protein
MTDEQWAEIEARRATESPAMHAARERLRFCNSYNRLETLIELADAYFDGDCFLEVFEWLQLLGEEWQNCDNIAQWAGALDDTPFAELADAPDDWRHCMMTPDELEAFNALPRLVTVWRGCYAHNKRGLSWSLSREVAERFPLLHRYRRDGQPLLIRAEVARDQILALKLGRNEAEVIAVRPKVRAISHINVSGA